MEKGDGRRLGGRRACVGGTGAKTQELGTEANQSEGAHGRDDTVPARSKGPVAIGSRLSLVGALDGCRGNWRLANQRRQNGACLLGGLSRYRPAVQIPPSNRYADAKPMETGWALSPLLAGSPGPATPDASSPQALTHLYKGASSHFASPFGILILVLAPPGTPEARHSSSRPPSSPHSCFPALFTTPPTVLDIDCRQKSFRGRQLSGKSRLRI